MSHFRFPGVGMAFAQGNPVFCGRAALAGLLILGASTGVQARKGYLPRIFKRNKAAAAEPAAAVPNVPMGRVVIPLNRLTADDVARMLDDAYGRDNAFSVVEPSRLAKGGHRDRPQE